MYMLCAATTPSYTPYRHILFRPRRSKLTPSESTYRYLELAPFPRGRFPGRLMSRVNIRRMVLGAVHGGCVVIGSVILISCALMHMTMAYTHCFNVFADANACCTGGRAVRGSCLSLPLSSHCQTWHCCHGGTSPRPLSVLTLYPCLHTCLNHTCMLYMYWGRCPQGSPRTPVRGGCPASYRYMYHAASN